MYSYILVFIASVALTFALFPLVYSMLKEAGVVEKNFRDEIIPIGMGLLYVITSPILLIISGKVLDLDTNVTLNLVIGILGIGIIGLVDDLLGDKNAKGFKGHVRALLGGKLTTGGLKAISGFGIAFLIALSISSGFAEIALNTFLIALFTNIVNLFDLRPGRACKAFIGLMAAVLAFQKVSDYNIMAAALLGVVAGYMRNDLKAKAMLGDVGSNSLGMSLGILCAVSCGTGVKAVFLAVLVALHVVSEFYSFTKIIENNRVLKFIDQLGRG